MNGMSEKEERDEENNRNWSNYKRGLINSHAKSVKKHGYKRIKDGKVPRIDEHVAFGHESGHEVHINPISEHWSHYANGDSKNRVSGEGMGSLEKHLSKLHSSQHAEQQPEPWEKSNHVTDDAAREIINDKYGK